MTATEMASLLRVSELQAMLGQPPGTRRLALRQMLAERHPDLAQDWRRWWPQAPDGVLHVAVTALCERLRLMFFGNLHQDWSAFVLSDLGIFNYERVEFSAASRAFGHASEIDTYLQLHAARDAVDEGAADTGIHAAIDALACATPWLAQRRDRIRFLLGQRAERARDWDAALRAYACSGWPGARYRRARVLERAGQADAAWQIAQQALHAPESDEERQRLLRMVPRLQRHLGLTVAPAKRDRPTVPTTALCIDRTDPAQRVELAVRDHLHKPAQPVFYVENALVNGLFGLLFWEAIFADVPGAFFHPFQIGPADLDHPRFAVTREAWMQSAWQALDDDSWRSLVRRRYAEKQGVLSPFVQWSRLSPELLEAALSCIPGTHLKVWFERLLTDIRANRTGWPDLIRFDPARRRYAMIEVKGPGDRLQDNQRRWLDHCVAHGMTVNIVHVTWRAGGSAGDRLQSTAR